MERPQKRARLAPVYQVPFAVADHTYSGESESVSFTCDGLGGERVEGVDKVHGDWGVARSVGAKGG